MANAPRVSGPTAQRVAANVRALRRARGLELSHLSERLERLGQPISLAGLSRLELGQRRVDVDDLMALALALDVTPLRLLLTATADADPVFVTPRTDPSTREAWEWATGERPPGVAPLFSTSSRRSGEDLLRWRRENTPHRDREVMSLSDQMEHAGVLAALERAAAAAEADGLSPESIHNYLNFRRAIRLAGGVFHADDDGSA